MTPLTKFLAAVLWGAATSAILAQATWGPTAGERLLVMKTLDPDGPEGANLIALGDSIRALMRAGLDSDAKRMGVEALLAHWPLINPGRAAN